MKQKITGFHKDLENHWVAELQCGHGQHVRHDPPWMERPWTQTQEGRDSRMGTELNCVRCEEAGRAVAEKVRSALLQAMKEAYEDAGLSGICEEGRIDLALDRLRSMDLNPVIQSALTQPE